MLLGIAHSNIFSEEEATRQAQNIIETFKKDHPDKKSVHHSYHRYLSPFSRFITV